MVSSAKAKMVGRFDLDRAQPQWGPGWHLGRIVDDAWPPRVLLRVSLTGEAPSLALEGAGRRKLASLLNGKKAGLTALPELLQQGSDKATSYLVFDAVAAVKLDTLIEGEPLPVPIALHYGATFARTMSILGLVRLSDEDKEHKTPIGPSFDEMLVSKEGKLIVTTPPPGARMALAGLLKVPRRDRFMHPPEGVRGDAAGDMFAIGSFLAQILVGGDPSDVERHPSVLGAAGGGFVDVSPARVNPDVPRRVDDIVRRATAADPLDRYESVDELLRDLAAASDDWPPVAADDAAAVVKSRAFFHLAEAERNLL